MKEKNKVIKLVILATTIILMAVILLFEYRYYAKESYPAKRPRIQLTSLPPSPTKTIVYLDKSSQWELEIGKWYTQGVLARELVRQAFLLSAREEAGFVTRDVWLGDAMPDEGPVEPINLRSYAGKPNELEVFVGSIDSKAVDSLELDIDPTLGYKDLLIKAENLSRKKFLNSLQRSGYVVSAKKLQSDVKIPENIEKLLSEMNFLSQYSAIRQLHELMGKQGESPFLLGGLVRGYANLGVLTDFHWHPAHKVFLARSLLYAQRMIAQGKQPVWAEWHRAYAFALTGLQGWALVDLEEAEKGVKKASPKDVNRDFAKPAWVDVINAYCRYDMDEFMSFEKQSINAEFVGMMQCRAHEQAISQDFAITQILDYVSKNPECYRMYDVLCRYGGVIVGHSATTDWLEVFRKKSYARLTAMPKLPEDIAKVSKPPSSSSGIFEKLFGRNESGDSNEFNTRRKLVTMLLDSGKDWQSKKINALDTKLPTDSGEPSWAALGQMIREFSFIQAFRRIKFEVEFLGVNADQTIAAFMPLYADHPFGEFLCTYSKDSEIKNAAINNVRSMPITGVEVQMFGFIQEIYKIDQVLSNQWVNESGKHLDFIEGDLTGFISKLLYFLKVPEREIIEFARSTTEISPHSPYAYSLLIIYDWDNISNRANELEENAASHPILLQSLAKHYMKANNSDDAIRCLKAAIKVSPDQQSYEMLAGLYKSTGDTKKYIHTLEEYLQYPDYHLSHGHFCETIAYHYMSLCQWHKAKPYAERAAETYSAWGLLCLANCCEAMRDWSKAEQLHKTVALRYTDSAFSWYDYCKRTGMGDVESARKVASEYAESQEKKNSFDLAFFYLLEKQPEKAITTLKSSNYSWDKFLLLSVADQVNDAATRDSTLRDILELRKNTSYNQNNMPAEEMIALFFMISEDIVNSKSKINVKTAEVLIEKTEPVTRLMCYYYLAKYLDVHGREKDAIELWKKALGHWIPINKFARTLSAIELHEHGVKPEEIEAVLPIENDDEETAPVTDKTQNETTGENSKNEKGEKQSGMM